MTRTLDEANRAVSTIMSMPYGVARSAAAEQEAARITAEGPDEARAYALFALVDSYTSTPEAEKAFLPFTQLLRWWDSHPELFDGSDTHSLFWSFKWMVGLLARFPSVPTAQLDATLDDMERRYALAGNGTSAVAGERFAWLRAQGAPGTEEAYRTWITTPRDSFSDCAACLPAGQAEYLAETGRVREAADVVSAAVASGATCGDEPAGMESLLELLLLDLGDASGAAAVHRSATSHLDAAVSKEVAASRHVEFLARTGHPERALRLLHTYPEHLTVSDSPGERLAVLTHVAVATGVLRETHADTPVDLAAVPARTVAELDTWARAEIAPIARAFDARHGTDRHARLLDAAWARQARRLPVELGVLAAAERAAAVPGATPDTIPDTMPDALATSLAGADAASPAGVDLAGVTGPRLDADPVGAALARAEGEPDPVEASAAYLTAARLAEEAGRLEDAGFALAEAAQVAATLGDDEGAVPAFARAVGLLRAAGTDPSHVGPVVRAAAAAQARAGDVDAALAAVERVHDDVARATRGVPDAPTPAMSEELAARRAAFVAAEERQLRDVHARLLATAGRHAEAARQAESVAEEFGRAGLPFDAAHAFWLAGSALRAAGDATAAVDPLRAALEGLAATGARADLASVADELVGTLRGLGRTEEADAVAASLVP
ncbi:hypothetical protein ACFQ80_09240 [Isoptericola sp. NPDC056578]|uniref:hypothetical protein n=1 Tax=Isoptericola sp. NPDC056578 TaxID=3345870 RepID=UPI0036BBDBF7